MRPLHLPNGQRLNITIYDILSFIFLAIVPFIFLAILSFYVAIPKAQIQQPVVQPSNIPARVPAMTTMAPITAVDEGLKVEKEGFTVIEGRKFRSPLRRQEYVVEIRQVVGRE